MKSKKNYLQIFALIIILAGIFGLFFTSTNSTTSITQLDQKDLVKTSQGTIKIGLAPGNYDDIGQILTDMGLTYTIFSYSPSVHSLENITSMRLFDILFIPCGTAADGASSTVISNVELYVQEGGVIYGSDWAMNIINGSFPGNIDFLDYDGATSWSNNSYIVDDALRQYLGKSHIDIEYDLGSWCVIDNVTSGVTTLIRGTVETYSGTLLNKPLSVRFSYGLGTVIYTTFHNEAQISADIELVLAYYIESIMGFTLLSDIYSVINPSSGQIIQTFVGNMTQGQNFQLMITNETVAALLALGVNFDLFLNWEGSEFNLIIDGAPHTGARPIKVNLPVTGLESKNITISAISTSGYEMCIAAFVGYNAQGSTPPGPTLPQSIPGFNLFIILGFLTVSIILLKKQIRARK